MSVGGRIIEMRLMPIVQDGSPVNVVRLWVVDRHGDETCVYAKPATDMPGLGEEVWWQGGTIYFDGDKKRLTKLAYSFKPETGNG